MDKIWLKSYPHGVPAEIELGAYPSIGAMFEASAATFRDRPAYANMGKAISFGDVERLSRAFGAWLQGRGIGKGARVALMMPNCLQYPICIFGVLRAGCAVANVNPLYTARELEYQLKDSGAEVIVVLENFARVVQEVVAHTQVRHVVVAALGDLLGAKGFVVNLVLRHLSRRVPAFHLPGAVRFNAAIAQGERASLRPVEVGPEDVAFLQYTGGTTGQSKAAVLVHRNILANLEQAAAWVHPFLNDQQQVMITALPLYHIFSLTANCLLMTKLGGCNVLITNPRDIAGFVKELARYQFTFITGVNTLFNGLLNNPDFAKLDFSKLRIALGGGMAVQRAVADRWKKVTGVTLVEAYGLSETSPAATINPLDLKEYNGSIGLPIPSTEVSILGDDGAELPVGEAGELCIRGPQVMTGYWNRPEETANAMTADGFFRTGDIATIDEAGFVRIVDRKKDMVLVSGFNVYPNEVEGVVALHPGVLECAVVGVPDADSGEAVKLFVVRREASVSEAELRSYCAKNLTGYKRPKYIEFRGELPKTNVGKILRRALRD